MKIQKSPWPFILVLCAILIGIPLIDRFVAKSQSSVAIEIIQESPSLANKTNP